MKMNETCWNEYRDPRMLVFKALACKNRMDIINTLKDGEKNVQQIAESMEIDFSVVSRHLTFLKNSYIIKGRKDGTSVFYSISDERVFDLIKTVTSIVKDRYDEMLKEMQAE